MKKILLALACAAATLTPLAAAHAQPEVDLSTNSSSYTALTLSEIGLTSAAGEGGTTGINGGNTDYYYFKVTSPASGVQLFLSDIQGGTSNITASLVGIGGDSFTVTPGNVSNETFSLSPNTNYVLAVTAGPGGNASFGANVVAVSAAPEPATWALMVFGVGAIGVAMRRSRRTERRALVAA